MTRLDETNNFLYLCVALVGILFSSAVVSQFSGTVVDTVFSLVVAAMFVLSLRSLHTETTWKRIVYGISVVFFLLALLVKFYPFKATLLFLYLLLFLYFVGSFKLAVRQILFKGVVDANKIVGSVSLYLLIGLVWTTIYLMLLVFDPTALNGIETADWEQLFSRVAYFSFVTLTTLGYGDISPASRIAEFFVEMEAVFGMFYMAIFVSSLINLAGRKLPRAEE